ncbi:MAG: alpha/beta hydrolase-fold protein [Planctomycetota bacterium]
MPILVAAVLLPLAGCRSTGVRSPFEAWLRELASAEDVDARVSARVAAAGGTPLRAGEEVLFLASSSRGHAPRIVGDFNAGGYATSEWLADGSMQRIGDSEWYSLGAHVPQDARLEYQVRWGDTAGPDPLNPDANRTFESERSVLQGPRRGTAGPEAVDARGALQSFPLRSTVRDNERSVTVYTPAGYDPNQAPLPTLYVKDGTRFLENIELPSILDALIGKGSIRPLVVVFIDPIERGLEYGTSGDYRRLVVEELVPEVERRFACGGAPDRRCLFGASRGGLAVIDLMARHPEVFGYCAAMSPALSPLPIVEELSTSERLAGEFLVLISRYDSPRLLADGEALVQALKSRTDRVQAVEMPIDHSPLGWKAWMDVVLASWSAL